MAAPRRTRQRVRRADGTEIVQLKPPRADVLWYPRYTWASVLVRRTHDLDLARELAQARWAEIGDDRPLIVSRVGWWRTYAARTIPADAAEDQLGRVVQFCRDDTAGAGAGVEFRP